jgi:hypothetical protein
MSIDKPNLRAASAVGAAGVLRAVTPSDSAALDAGTTRALFVGGEGAVAVEDSTGHVVVLESAAGQYHPIAVRRVLATGTTATAIVALY